MEILVLTDALKRASAKEITAVIPYFGYARQDRKAKPRQPITSRLVADLLTVAGVDRVVTVDLHARQIQGFFDIPVDEMEALPLICRYIKIKILKIYVLYHQIMEEQRVLEKCQKHWIVQLLSLTKDVLNQTLLKLWVLLGMLQVKTVS